MQPRKVRLFVATSLDGYIAGPDHDLSFLQTVERAGEDYGYAAYAGETDTVVIGRSTWEKVSSDGVTSPFKEKQVYVISSSGNPESGPVVFYSGNLTQLIRELKSLAGKDIQIEGGPQMIGELLNSRLLDSICISTIPVLLGNGIPLFREGLYPLKLELLQVKGFSSGLVQTEYNVIY
ncbi:dihydrofolate reductase [Lentimicrobium saccharophilum]|uniref:Dihydrofolate reductase n=1 Tax=Lentimicrobium saccharophilum TaxID=1678841 RepID=A0A0S7BVX4_9BACT|nr:dihydrofolate reductase family protein [Lentimicrobium saccharophilum]GAP42306.1 dihydrofolate reductase [Lentimicrobium saccharophilum]